jgi:hypothetical protein
MRRWRAPRPHANAKITAQVYAGLTEKAKAEVAGKLVKSASVRESQSETASGHVVGGVG